MYTLKAFAVALSLTLLLLMTYYASSDPMLGGAF